jgi:hypothetical protein
MKHVLTALCMRALIDQTTQNLTLVDVVEVLYAPIEENSEGALGVSLDLISMWRRDEAGKPETGRARVGVFGPDSKLIGQHLTYEVDLTVAPRGRNITKFAAFPIRGIGEHLLAVDVESPAELWERRGEWSVLISAFPAAKPSNS